MIRLREISEHLAGDPLNMEKQVKELSDLRAEMLTASEFEHDQLRLVNIVAAAGNGGTGGGGAGFR